MDYAHDQPLPTVMEEPDIRAAGEQPRCALLSWRVHWLLYGAGEATLRICDDMAYNETSAVHL